MLTWQNLSISEQCELILYCDESIEPWAMWELEKGSFEVRNGEICFTDENCH